MHRIDRTLEEACDAKAAPGLPRHLAWLGALVLLGGLFLVWLWAR